MPTDAREIGRIMNQMAGWENRGNQIHNGIYRKQRCWEKQEPIDTYQIEEV